jgi:hypothetical protein
MSKKKAKPSPKSPARTRVTQAEAVDQYLRLKRESLARKAADIRPNRSIWVLPDGQVIDVETDGATEDGSAFSHGIYVKKWISFRADRFHPNESDWKLAWRMRERAKKILEEDPSLVAEPEEDGTTNPFSGDLAYNQAAEEEGWVRIKPLTRPTESTIYAETISGSMSPQAEHVVRGACELNGLRVVVLSGGALANRAKGISVGLSEEHL